jgi:hypothetical protein
MTYFIVIDEQYFIAGEDGSYAFITDVTDAQ